jgi:RHS repeat-associated protein
MTTAPKPGAEATPIHLRYDAWNRLAEVDSDSGGSPGAAIATYAYDGLNRRVKKTVGTDAYDYYYNEQWQVLEVRKNGSANPVEQWVWDQRYVDAPLLRWHDSDTDGTADDTLYACDDANMNVTALVDASGTVQERYAYDPYGKVSVFDGSWAGRSASSYAWEVLYAGYRYDSKTGLCQVRNRYLHPTLGIWAERDPVASPAYAKSDYLLAASGITIENISGRSINGLLSPIYYSSVGPNLYVYVGSDVTAFLDPMGLLKVCCRTVKGGFPNNLVKHCEIDSECPADNATDHWESYDITRDYAADRELDNGKCPCKDATDQQIHDCINKHGNKAKPFTPGSRGMTCEGGEFGNNCQTSTIYALGLCCLKSAWVPDFYAGNPRGKCVESHTELRTRIDEMLGVVAEFVDICDKWELPDWQGR